MACLPQQVNQKHLGGVLMYIIDGFVCAGNAVESIKITNVKPLEDRIMLVTFNSGETRVFDSAVLNGSVYEPLQDKAIFENVSLDHGVVTWLDGSIDCAPEYIYENSYEYSDMIA